MLAKCQHDKHLVWLKFSGQTSPSRPASVADAVSLWGADLVVVGSHGRRGMGRVLLGSDAEQIIRMSPGSLTFCVQKAGWLRVARARTFTMVSPSRRRPGSSRNCGAVVPPPLSKGLKKMTIDWNAFTPWSSLAGGVLIGIAAAMFALLNGRVAGISGVLGGLLKPVRGDIAWRVAFVLGLLIAPLAYTVFSDLPRLQIDAGTGGLVLAGLLVGIGTRYGSGCTSGHGVCGLSRLSPRSLVATLAFMGAGFITVYLIRHLIGI